MAAHGKAEEAVAPLVPEEPVGQTMVPRRMTSTDSVRPDLRKVRRRMTPDLGRLRFGEEWRRKGSRRAREAFWSGNPPFFPKTFTPP